MCVLERESERERGETELGGGGLNFWESVKLDFGNGPSTYYTRPLAGRWKQFANNSDESDSSRQYLIEYVVFMSNRDFATSTKPQKLKRAPKRKYIHIIFCITSAAFVSRNTGIRQTESNSFTAVCIPYIIPTFTT